MTIQSEISSYHLPIPAQKRVQIFRSIQDMKTLFAYLNSGPISLEYCKETLKIENLIPIIRALGAIGVEARIDPNTSTIFLDQRREEPIPHIGSALHSAIV